MSVSLNPKTVLEWPDYVILLLVLIISVGISIYFKRRKMNSDQSGGKLEEFLFANRSLSILPVAFSMGATFISSTTLLGTSGDLYMYGVEIFFLFISRTSITILLSFYMVPIYRKTRYVSVFRRIEERFDLCVCRLLSLIYMINRVLQLGLVLYLPALSIATLTPFDTRVTSCILGIVCTIYSAIGGFRTVIWTDVYQFILLTTAVFMVIFQSQVKADSLSHLWQKSIDNGFLLAINFTESEATRSSVWAIIFNGVFYGIDVFLTNQAVMQRIMAAKSEATARNSVIAGSIFILVVVTAILTVGAVLYVTYGHCNPMKFSEFTGVKRQDQMFVYAIGDLFMDYPVLKGLAIAGIISAALSTFSSFVNSLPALALEDFIKPIFPRLNHNEGASVKICVYLSFSFGILATIISFVIPYFGNTIKALNTINGSTRGPMAGTVLLALFYKKITKKICVFSLLLSMVFQLWVILGNAFYIVKPKYATLLHSIDECQSDYSNIINSTINVTNSTQVFDFEGESFFKPLYNISYMWYNVMGLTTNVLTATLLSEILSYWKGHKNVPAKKRSSRETTEAETVPLA